MIPSKKIDTTRKKAFSIIIPILLLCFGANYAQPNLTANSQPHTISYNSGNKVQEFTLPNTITSGRIQFDTYGGDGGFKKNYPSQVSVRAKGGQGAVIKATFSIGQGPGKIPPGARILFIPGEHGQNRSNAFANGAGGGGGSAVFFQEANGHWTMLAVAGGGRGGAADCCLVQEDGRPGEPHGCVLIGTNEEGSNDYCFYTGTLITSLCNAGGSAFTDNANASSWSPLSSSNCDACLVGKMGWPGASSIPTNAVKPTGGYGGGYNSNGNACTDLDRKGGFGFGGGGIGSTGGGFSGGGAGGGFTSHIDRGGGSYLNEGLALADYPRERIRRSSTTDPQHGKIIYTITPDPVILCHNKTATLTNSNPTYIPFNTLAEVTSNPSGSTFLYSNSNFELEGVSFDCADLGPQTVNFLVLENGTSFYQACTVTVTVVDGGAPSVSCNDISVTTDANGQAIIDVGQVLQNYQDNCTVSPSSLSLDRTSFNYTEDCEVNGQTKTETVTLTAQDDNGNQASCTSTVTIVLQVADSTPPSVSCNDISITTDANGQAMVNVGQIFQSYQDNCTVSPSSLSLDRTSFNYTEDCSVNGQTKTETVTLTAQDDNGNQASCTSTVTIILQVADSTPPQALCKDITMALNGQSQVSIMSGQLDAASFDNCSTVSTQLQQPNVFLEVKGDRFVRETSWQITSLDGNTVHASIAPYSLPYISADAALRPTDFSYNITLDPGCYLFVWNDGIFSDGFLCAEEGGTFYYELTDDSGNVITYDECEGIKGGSTTQFCVSNAPTLVNELVFDCQDEGIQEVNLTVTNEEGLQSTCTSTVTIVNSVPSCPTAEVEVQLPETGLATLIASELGTATADACGAPLRYGFKQPSLQLEIQSDGWNNDFWWEITSADGQTIYDSGSGYPSDLDPSIPDLQQRRLAQIRHFVVDIPFPRHGNFIFKWKDSFVDGFLCAEDNADYFYRLTTSTGAVLAYGECESIGGGVDTPFSLSHNNNPGNAWYHVADKVFSCSDAGYHYATVSTITSTGRVMDCKRVIKVKPPAPVAICENITVELDINNQATFSIDDINNTTLPCNGYQITSTEPSFTTFDCSDIGTQTVALTVSDVYEQESTCTAFISVRDNTPPNASCKNLSVQLNENGQVSIDANQFDAGSIDNCSVNRLYFDDYQSTRTFSCDQVGTINLWNMILEDNAGLTDYCDVVLTILDNTPPAAKCQDISIELDHNGQANITPDMIDKNSSDNCGIATFDLDLKEFSCSNVGISNTVNLTVTDIYNNSSSCTASVSVEDHIAPEIDCVDITVALQNDGTVGVGAELIADQVSDNCSFTIFDNPFKASCSDVGIVPFSFSAIDASGNESACTINVNIEDNTVPIARCQNVTVQLDEGGIGSITANAINNGSSDACGITNLSLSQQSFDCSDVGSQTISLTAYDANGNSSSCDATVTIEDNVAPIATCQNVTVQLDESGIGSITANAINNGSSDACGIANLSLSQQSFDCSDVGSQTISLTAYDVNGNSSSCDGTVTVEDNVAPIANCQNVTVQLDESGIGSITANAINNGSSDACGIANLSLSQQSFGCSDVGSQTVSLTVYDANGNSSSCEAIVNIVDTIKPTLTCPEDILVNTDSGECGAYVSLPKAAPFDNCGIKNLRSRYRAVSADGTPIEDWSFWANDQSGFFSVGFYQVQWRAKDDSNNKGFCRYTLEVRDEEAPEVVCKDVSIMFNGEARIDISSASIFDAEASFDACGAVSFVSQSLAAIGCEAVSETVEIEIIGIDPNGNTNSCTAEIEVMGMPCGFTETGIDCEEGTEATYDPEEESFTLTAEDCTGYPDGEVAFVGTTLCGDGEVSVRIDAISPSARAGVVMMESIDPGAKLVAIVKDLTRRVRTEYRSSTGGSLRHKSKNRSGVDWLRIVRSGNKFKTYTSTNGSYWRLAHTVNFSSFAECIEVGLITYAKDAAEEATAVFSELEISGENSSYNQAILPPVAMESHSSNNQTGGNLELKISPNPFQEETRIHFSLEQMQAISLSIYDLQGRQIKRLYNGPLEAGDHQWQWHGNDSDGNSLPAGVYIVQLRYAEQVINKRVIYQP